MIKRILNVPALTIILSLIPGLAIWLFGKRKQAVGIIIALIFISVLFILFPSIIMWYLFCILYIGQMVYSAGLSIWQCPDNGKREIGLNSGFPVPLPEKMAAVKRLEETVFETLSNGIRPDSDLKIAILGLDTNSLKYKLIGFTENNLVIADCTTQGYPKNIRQIQKSDVAWVSLQTGERSCLMSIKFEEERYTSIFLKIPRKLRNKAIEFTKEFSGSWDEDWSPIEVFETIHNLGWQPNIIIVSIISGAFIIFGMIPPSQSDLLLILIKPFSTIFGFFLLGWPFVLWLIKQIKKEPAFTSTNFMLMFFIIPSILSAWFMVVYPLGLVILEILESIKQSGF